MKNGAGPFPDEDVMVIARAEGARIADPDPSIDRGTTRPQKLLKNTGALDTRIIESILPPVRISEQANRTFEAAKLLTVTSFSSANAIRATNSHDGVDWRSSNTSTPCACCTALSPAASAGSRPPATRTASGICLTTSPPGSTRGSDSGLGARGSGARGLGNELSIDSRKL
jgi:hypothetical protein